MQNLTVCFTLIVCCSHHHFMTHRNSKEVAQMLDRCNKVHQALCQADQGGSSAAVCACPATACRKSVSADAAAAKAAKSARIAAIKVAQAPPSRFDFSPGRYVITTTVHQVSDHSCNVLSVQDPEILLTPGHPDRLSRV